MTSLITGAAGFMGAALAKALEEAGETVLRASRAPRTAPGWVHIEGAVRPAQLKGVRTIYHLGWSSVPATAAQDPAADLIENAGGMVKLMQAAQEAGVTRFVFASSGGTVYGVPMRAPVDEEHPARPFSAYGLSKRTAETYLEHFARNGLDAAALRFGNVYGPGQPLRDGFGLVASTIARALKGEPVPVFGDGGHLRDYVYIHDAVDALLAAGRAKDLSKRIINIGGGAAYSVTQVVEAVQAALGHPVQIDWRPARPFDVRSIWLDITRAHRVLNWQPATGFYAGIALTVAAARES